MQQLFQFTSSVTVTFELKLGVMFGIVRSCVIQRRVYLDKLVIGPSLCFSNQFTQT